MGPLSPLNLMSSLNPLSPMASMSPISDLSSRYWGAAVEGSQRKFPPPLREALEPQVLGEPSSRIP